MEQPHESAFPFPLCTDDSLPENVMLIKDCKGVSHGQDGDFEIWGVGYDDWYAMTPEQRAEFDLS